MPIKNPITRPYITTTNDRTQYNTVGPINHYFHKTLSIFKMDDLDSRNEPEYTEYPLIPCYYDRVHTQVMDTEGNMVICSGILYCDLEVLVDPIQDYIVYEFIRYNPVTVRVPQHFIDSHQEIYLR